MIASPRRMVTYHWPVCRIKRYLDNDPMVPVTPSEVTRLDDHLADHAPITVGGAR